MDATTAFGHRSERLLQKLRDCQGADEAARAVSLALEQTACELMQDEEDERTRQRQQAVFALAKRAPSLLRVARAEGELRAASLAPVKGSRAKRLLCGAGALILAALAIAQLADGKIIYAALQAVGAALLFFGGAGASAPRAAEGLSAAGVLKIDPEATVAALAELMAAADVCVSDLALLDASAPRSRLTGTADDATLDLLVALMEAKATGRGDVALASLAQAEQYLSALGVSPVWYSKEDAALFDLLPTTGEARTIRPALVKDGRPLRRGVAVIPAERSVGA